MDEKLLNAMVVFDAVNGALVGAAIAALLKRGVIDKKDLIEHLDARISGASDPIALQAVREAKETVEAMA